MSHAWALERERRALAPTADLVLGLIRERERLGRIAFQLAFFSDHMNAKAQRFLRVQTKAAVAVASCVNELAAEKRAAAAAQIEQQQNHDGPVAAAATPPQQVPADHPPAAAALTNDGAPKQAVGPIPPAGAALAESAAPEQAATADPPAGAALAELETKLRDWHQDLQKREQTLGLLLCRTEDALAESTTALAACLDRSRALDAREAVLVKVSGC